MQSTTDRHLISVRPMLDLDDFLQPVGRERFVAEYQDRKPLHIPAATDAGRAPLFSWAEMNTLLSQTAIWTPENLKLLHNGANVAPEHYCVEVVAAGGRTLRPSPAKIEVWLSRGASLVANDIHTMAPGIADLSRMLGRTFSGLVGANAYCSFHGVQAFGTHYDLHEVFAVHCEGEKVWRLYQGRAENPIGFDPHQTPQWLEQSRGALMQEVRMRPGDILYLPRGWYHDALANGDASLHVTFSVTPLYGRIIFSLLESAALQDPAFRAWLPPAHQDGGRALKAHLAALGQRLSALAEHPQFADDVAMTQECLVQPVAQYGLPVRKALTRYRRTNLLPPAFVGPVAIVMEWAFAQPEFALEDICAQFDFVDDDAILEAVQKASNAGALVRA